MSVAFSRAGCTSARGATKVVKLVICASTVWFMVGINGETALAQERVEATVAYAIPAGRLGAAITRFGALSGLQIIYPANLVSGKTTRGIGGSMSREAALSQLLSGTGLSYQFNGLNIVTLVDSASSSSDVPFADGTTVLDQLVVAGGRDSVSGSGFQGTPDWVYDASESVSVLSREAVQNSGVRDTRDLMATVSGVYSGEGNGSFPTVSPNIRGLQDSGRVVVSIDGARQNAQRGFGNGSSGYQSNSGQAYVDGAFVRTIEVDKDPDASAGNAGSLGGSVNFRTVGSDDLIDGDRNWGVEANLTRGTNEYNFQGSVLGAARLADTPFSVTAGFSKFELGAYEAGQSGGEISNIASVTERDSLSTLLKLEGDFGDVETTLSWMHQTNNFGYQSGGYINQETANVDSVAAKLLWNPDSELIDFAASFWLNNTNIKEQRPARPTYPDTEIDLNTLSFGGVLENTSVFDTLAGVVEVNYGVEAFRDIAGSAAYNTDLELHPELTSHYTAFNPPGNRDVVSGFAKADWDVQDWMTLSGGLRYDWYRLHGAASYFSRHEETTGANRIAGRVDNYLQWMQTYNSFLLGIFQSACDAANDPNHPSCLAISTEWPNTWGEIDDDGRWVDEGNTIWGRVTTVTYPEHALDMERSDGAWLPTLKAELTPTEWFKPYISYSHSFRPPTVLEAFFAGGLPGGSNPATNYAPNTALRPEQARTIEIGANVNLDGIFTDDDRFRFKASAFQREVDDYVVLGYIANQWAPKSPYLSFVNLDGTTYMYGVELEGNYDTGHFWLGGSATWLETAWPTSTEVFAGVPVDQAGDIFAVAGNVPPRFKLTVDGGVRLLDEKLQIGARLNHVTPTLSRTIDKDTGEAEERTEPYTTVDVYGSYQFSDNATLRMAVNNVTDLNYIPGTAAYNAPGRTFTASLNVKF